MFSTFLDRVRDRAYHKYLHRIQNGLIGDSMQDWLDAELEESLEEKIKEEAFLHYLKYGFDDYTNYIEAKKDVMGRIRLLAYYMHERNYNKRPAENWVDAEKLYVNEF